MEGWEKMRAELKQSRKPGRELQAGVEKGPGCAAAWARKARRRAVILEKGVVASVRE